MTRISFVRTLQAVSFLALAAALGIVAFARLHGSSLRATTVRITERVQAYGEPKPYEAHVFIPIPFDEQDHALSCEVATLKMVLGYRGVRVGESVLIARIGNDPTPLHYQDGKAIWGDPHEAFVGDIDGRMMVTGYGVSWEPIERAAKRYRPSEGFVEGTVERLVGELQAGNPIIIWGCLGPCTPTVWYTDVDGQVPIRAVTYEHTFIVNGFQGAPERPDGFWLIDPIYGRTYRNLDAFTRMWDTSDRSGVVVH